MQGGSLNCCHWIRSSECLWRHLAWLCLLWGEWREGGGGGWFWHALFMIELTTQERDEVNLIMSEITLHILLSEWLVKFMFFNRCWETKILEKNPQICQIVFYICLSFFFFFFLPNTFKNAKLLLKCPNIMKHGNACLALQLAYS